MTGPKTSPTLDARDQLYTTQIRSLVSHKSSMLPAITAVGIADRNPVTKRPRIIPDIDGTVAVNAQKMLYSAVLVT